jgi:CheY-like chemotaxis protein
MVKAGERSVQDVLIIEDNELVRRSLERAFVKQGYTVATAGDGQEALRDLALSDGPPKIIIMDLMMPVMDGWKLRQCLLEQPRWARVPVIAFSGSGVEDADNTLPGVLCILKPVSLQTLFENVARLIAETTTKRVN